MNNLIFIYKKEKMKQKIVDWWIWKFFKSSIFIMFLLFFGFFASVAYFSERRENKRNNKSVQVMQEDILYIRPVGFQEKQPNDTISIEELK